jgi:hypothetical protein
MTTRVVAGACAAIAVVVIAVVAGQHLATAKQNAYNAGYDLGLDMRSVANAEGAYRASHPTYTTDDATLRLNGFAEAPGQVVTLLLGIDGGASFCVVGWAAGTAPWFTYDSQGGLNSTLFSSASDAEAACTDHAIGSFSPVS